MTLTGSAFGLLELLCSCDILSCALGLQAGSSGLLEGGGCAHAGQVGAKGEMVEQTGKVTKKDRLT